MPMISGHESERMSENFGCAHGIQVLAKFSILFSHEKCKESVIFSCTIKCEEPYW